MADEQEVRATKAKNLLSSITALSFADGDDSTLSEEAYLAETTLIQQILRQHQVFRFVFNGNALNKYYTTMIQQTKNSSPLRQEVAMKFLALAAEGSAMEYLDPRISKLLDVVYHALKHQHVSVCVPALHILTHLMFNIENIPVETRRTVIEQVGRFVPLILQHINSLSVSQSTAPFYIASYEALYVGCKSLSTNFRPFASKIEQACIVLLSPEEDSINATLLVLPAMAKCFGAIAHATATDVASATWQQMLERVVLTLHYQLDVLSGKDKESESHNRPASLKPWLKDTVMPTLSIFLRAERLVFKTQVLAVMLTALIESSAIAEKDITIVANDVLALLRRAFSVRADSVGKQSAISEDGRQLPSSVLYGILPSLQPLFMAILSALVVAGHVTMFRFASSIAKVVQLSCQTTQHEAYPALHSMLQHVVSAMGSGGFKLVGATALEWTLSQLQPLIATEHEKPVQTPQLTVSSGNKKKRQRQAEASTTVAKIATPTVYELHHMRIVKNAALETLAIILPVGGSWISDGERKRITAIVYACQQDLTLENTVVTKVSLANAVAPDNQGIRGLALAQNMQYWTRRTSGPWKEVALCVGESVMHPRAPPMALSSSATPEEKIHSKKQISSAARSKRLEAEMDWDDENSDDETGLMVHSVNTTELSLEVSQKKQKVDDVDEESEEEEDMDDIKAIVEDDVAEVEEEECTPEVTDEISEVVEETKDESAAEDNSKDVEETKDDDEGEFDFPDIVVDEDDE